MPAVSSSTTSSMRPMMAARFPGRAKGVGASDAVVRAGSLAVNSEESGMCFPVLDLDVCFLGCLVAGHRLGGLALQLLDERSGQTGLLIDLGFFRPIRDRA